MSPRGQVWFRRFAEVPGVAWTTPPGIDRTEIPGHDAVPEVQKSYDGSDALWWPVVYPWDDEDDIEDGSTSASPASQYPREEAAETMAEELRRLGEALELPGEPSTYHFIIAGAAANLFGLRRREPAAIRESERLCWLDLDLVRAHPGIIQSDRPEEATYRLAVTGLLYRIYMDSGDLRSGEKVASMAVGEFAQTFERQLTDVRARLALQEAEDA